MEQIFGDRGYTNGGGGEEGTNWSHVSHACISVPCFCVLVIFFV